MSFLTVKNLCKSFGENVILNDINLELAQGQSYAIVGSSGCGKSTLLQILGLLDDQYQGEYLLLNKNIKDLSPSQKQELRRKSLGFVYQFHYLIPELTTAQNIAIPLKLQHTPIEIITEKVELLLKKIDLAQHAKKFPHQLSGGQRQRIAVARAIIHQPQLIIADEPTGNLDQKNTTTLFQMLQDLISDQNSSLLIATHNLNLAQQCTKIINL